MTVDVSEHSQVERNSLHRDVEFSCTIFPRMDLFFIFNMLNAICVSDDASAADASRRQKTRSNARVEYMICFSMKNAPFSFLGLALTKDAITFAFLSSEQHRALPGSCAKCAVIVAHTTDREEHTWTSCCMRVSGWIGHTSPGVLGSVCWRRGGTAGDEKDGSRLSRGTTRLLQLYTL